MALGASVLLSFAPLAVAQETQPGAQETLPGRRSAADAAASRPAVERWRRLKTKYEAEPGPVAATPVEQPISSGKATVTPVVRPIPDDPAEFQPRTVSIQSQAVEAPIEAPVAPIASEPKVEVALPAPVAPAEVIAPRQESVAVDESRPGSQEQPKPAYEEKNAIRTPVEVDRTIGGTPRQPLGTISRSGPLRTATQLRRIGDIAPRMDLIQDSDIKDFAAEQALDLKVKFGGDHYAQRSFPDMVMPWVPPENKYYPLYFQDPALERYGHSHSHLVQPVISSARFTTQLVLLPYQMAITPPWELQSPLGWYRPGDVVPKLRYPFPWSTKAAVVEAATVTGIIFAIP